MRSRVGLRLIRSTGPSLVSVGGWRHGVIQGLDLRKRVRGAGGFGKVLTSMGGTSTEVSLALIFPSSAAVVP